MALYRKGKLDGLRRRRILQGMVGLSAMIGLGAASRLAYASKAPLKIICPFTSGSGADVISRYIAEHLAIRLGRPVIVDNRAGGNGQIAAQALKSQPADGQTLLLGTVSMMSINPVVLRTLGYDPVKDFTAVTGVYRGSSVFAVHPDSPYKTLQQLLQAAKEKRLAIGSYSPGYRLAAEYLASLAGVRFTDIPYRGQAPLLADLLGNHMDAAVLEYGGAVSSLQAGKLRALAITSEQRHFALPAVPAVRELGFPEYRHYGWTAFFVRSGTAAGVVSDLTSEIQAVLSDKSTIQFIRNTVYGDPMPLGPEEMRSFIQKEVMHFRDVAAAAGMEKV